MYNKRNTALNQTKHCDESNKTLRITNETLRLIKQNTAINQTKHYV